MSQAVLSEEYLVTHRTKRATRGWKAVCPSCSGNDLWYTQDNGSAFCFECGAVYHVAGEHDAPGRSRAAASGVPIDIPAVRHIYTTLRGIYQDMMTPRQYEFLASRGIDRNLASEFQLGYCSPAILPLYQLHSAKDAGICDARGNPLFANRIVFPYNAEQLITDMRGRILGDAQPRYASPRLDAHSRGALYPFNHDRALTRVRETGTVIVTEGEIKTILADAHGYAAVGLPGMTTWRQGLIDFLPYKVVAIFDSSPDRDDQIRVHRALWRLAQRIPKLYVGVLPLAGERKQDIDSYLLHPKGGAARFEHVVRNAPSFAVYSRLRSF